MSDDITRDPVEVLRAASAEGPWAIWHPGDGTQYRVKVVVLVGGPDHTDRVLLIAVGGKTIAVQYQNPDDPSNSYRLRKWTKQRWRSEGDLFGKYDPWDSVVKPLLEAAGVA